MASQRPMGKFLEPEWPDNAHNHNFVYEEGEPTSVVGGTMGWKVCTRCHSRKLIRMLVDNSTGEKNEYIWRKSPENLTMNCEPIAEFAFPPVVTKCRKCHTIIKIRKTPRQPDRIYCPNCKIEGSPAAFGQHLLYLLKQEFPHLDFLFPDAPHSEPDWEFFVEFDQ